MAMLFMASWLFSNIYAADWSDPSGASPATFKDIEVVFEKILNIVVAAAGIIIFIMFIVGGFKLLFSSGDPEKVKKATGTITWAIIGLLILLGTWLVFLFIHQFTGIDVTEFEIP